MYRKSLYNFKNAPKILKILITLTACLSILAAIVPSDHIYFFLGLSKIAILKSYFWQFLSNVFIIPQKTISFSFVFHLAFNLYMIWMFGISIIQFHCQKHLIYLFLITSIVSSTVAFFTSQTHLFLGANIPIYSFAIAWLMINKEAKLILFFSIPIKATTIILTIIAINLLSLLSQGSYDYFLAYTTSGLTTYIFSLIVWKKTGPIKALNRFEEKVINIFSKTKKATIHKFQKK